MNSSTIALESFIKDFDLRHSDGVVYFEAIIHLLIKGNMQVQTSEVHIITSDHLDTLYINDLDSFFFQLPEMFEARKQLFFYVDHKCLKIEGEGGLGKFRISIFPKEK